MEKSRKSVTADLAMPATTRGGYTGPMTDTERTLAEVLANVVDTCSVSIDSHFFDDLGANSLVMAQFCARVRKRGDLPSISMKDIYRHPTIRSLVAALAQAAPPLVESPTSAAPVEEVELVSTPQYVLCGALQLLIFLGYTYLLGIISAWGYDWIYDAPTWINLYLRAIFFVSVAFVSLCCFPIAAKWLLIGRWQAGEFPIWSLAYVRFWIVKALVHINPMLLFVGTPLYVLYLRALGARIGKHVTILSRSIPVCTDLLTIGPGTVIRKNSSFLCYRAYAGRIQTGPVTLGRDVYVGEMTVLDINTSMGNEAQLGHTSALQKGEAIPDGQWWHGTPAQRTQLNYLRVAPARCSSLRRICFSFLSLFMLFFVYIPLAIAASCLLVTWIPPLAQLLISDENEVVSPDLYIYALIFSLALFFGLAIINLVVAFTIPRLLNLAIKPDKVYPLYGLHYAIHLTITGLTNNKFFTWLFGDSSYIVHYLRGLGYNLPQVVQTGANFGTVIQHDNPYLSTIGSGTMVCDGLSIINADYSSTSFCVSRTSIGADNFLGNGLAIPPGARTGKNCLIATKTMLPLDGEIREGVGLLGSPCFEIPRSVERDSQFDHLRTGDELRRRLAAKNRYNIRTMILFLFIQWLHIFAFMVLSLLAISLYHASGSVSFTADFVLSTVFSTVYFILVERAFRRLRPQFCSIYDPYYWWHERYWKLPVANSPLFNGTPFKGLIWRLLGVEIGCKVFDDGCNLTERTLAIIGDNCTLNAGTEVQCHSLEDGTFKSDYTRLGAGCTLEVGALIHYGVTIGEGAILAADSFLMKGEEIPPHASWGGNPARALANSHAASIPQMIAHHVSSPEGNHLNGHAHHLIEDNTAAMQIYQDSNNHYDTGRTVRQQGAARRSLKGGKIRWEN
jgi:non-ribosomal peptide synthetase-like protein